MAAGSCCSVRRRAATCATTAMSTSWWISRRTHLDDAWNFAERACWDRRLEPDITPFSWCRGRFLERVTPDLQVVGMSDERWSDIEADTAAAVGPFLARRPDLSGAGLHDDIDGYTGAWLHARDACGHTRSKRPCCAYCRSRKRRRVAPMARRPDPARRPTLPGRPAWPAPSSSTRKFRHVAVRAYDTFDPDDAEPAVRAAEKVAAGFAAAIAAYRQAVDPPVLIRPPASPASAARSASRRSAPRSAPRPCADCRTRTRTTARAHRRVLADAADIHRVLARAFQRRDVAAVLAHIHHLDARRVAQRGARLAGGDRQSRIRRSPPRHGR